MSESKFDGQILAREWFAHSGGADGDCRLSEVKCLAVYMTRAYAAGQVAARQLNEEQVREALAKSCFPHDTYTVAGLTRELNAVLRPKETELAGDQDSKGRQDTRR